jgi:hypothetical protein
MQGVNDYVARQSAAKDLEITQLNQTIRRLEYRIGNAKEYLKGRAYPENAINLAEHELNLAMSGK